MSTKGRITYRFDKQSGARMEPRPEQRRASDANAVPYFQEELKFSSEIGTWNSPFQNDAYALEQLIREADGQVPSQRPSKGRLPESRDHSDRAFRAEEPAFPEIPAENIILLGDEEGESQFEADVHPYAKRVSSPNVIDMYPQIEIEHEHYHSGGKRIASMPIGKMQSGSGRRPAQGPSWFKVFASVAGAIATGALFGYFVLTLFTGGSSGDLPADNQGSVPTIGANATGGGAKATDSSDGNQSATGTNATGAGSTGAGTALNGQGTAVKVKVPAASYYMLQYGVFSNEDGLNAAASELRAKGLAAASLTSPDDYRIYVGVSADRDEAELLGQTLTGMDVYVKQIDVPALSSIAYDGKAADIQAFFKDTGDLIAKLDDLTIAGLSGGAAKDQAGWQSLHQQWTESASRMEAGLRAKTDKATMQQLMQAVNTAAIAAGEYAKKPSQSYLWSMQSALMNTIFIQKGWFASLESL